MTVLCKILRYLDATEMPETKFGRLCVRDPRLVSDLKRGRMLRPETEQRIEAFLASRGTGR